MIGTPPVQVDSGEKGGGSGEVEAGEGAGAAAAGSASGGDGGGGVAPAGAGVPAERVVALIPLDRIRANPLQPRRVFEVEKLRELARSIERTGVMQPVVVRQIAKSQMANGKSGGEGDGRSGMGDPEAGGGARTAAARGTASSGGTHEAFELIAGERRWRAARLAGLETIPAIVREVSDEVSAEWALIENVQREDLGPLEKGAAFRVLSERFGLTQEEIAQRVGLDRSSVSNLMRLMELEEEICEMLDRGSLGLGHGKALLACAPGARRVALARKAALGMWPVRKLEEAVRAGGESLADAVERAGRERKEPGALDRPASVRELEKQLGEHLGTKVKVTGGKEWKRGKIVIDFFDLDQFDGLMGKMGFAMRE